MAAERELSFDDLTRAVDTRDPTFPDLVKRYLDQPDPPENQPEVPPDDADTAPLEAELPPLPDGAWTLEKLQQATSSSMLSGKTASERKAIRLEAWRGLMSAPYPPPRLRLGELLVRLYTSGDPWARAALLDIFHSARAGYGLWQGIKRIYKIVEQQHDFQLFGLLAWRLDTLQRRDTTGEISSGTLIYMKRRAWRYMRQLGTAVPELFPQLAVEVLRHYQPDDPTSEAWVLNQILGHKRLVGHPGRGWIGSPPHDLKLRAFPDTWKASPAPLLQLLEDAGNDDVCDFAIRSLQEDHPEALRTIAPAWIARIGSKPLESVHTFVVSLLKDSPEFHQSRLRELGLHDMVLSFLWSRSDTARAYALDYARAHAPDLPVSELVALVCDGDRDVQKFALTGLGRTAPKDIGIKALITLLGVSAAQKLAQEKLKKGFSPGDFKDEDFVALFNGNVAQRKFVMAFYKEAKARIPAPYFTRVLETDRCGYQARREALRELEKRSGEEIGLEWVKKALLDRRLGRTVSSWLRKGKFKGDALDVDWVKGLVMRPSLRELAFQMLGNPKIVSPARIGLSWLLAMARQPDEELSSFAHQYLLQHFTPDDFALEMDSLEVEDGIQRLFQLAAGPKEPDAIRAFAATYLKLHHPELGPTLPEAKSLGISPLLTHDAYRLDRVRPLFNDARADVRQLATAIGRLELVRWDSPALLFELASSRHREPRKLAARALLRISEVEDPSEAPPEHWLTASRVFALAESPYKSTREVALTLIRRHYDRLGGADRLSWLMETPDREVRLFAVRLLWDKHRPNLPPDAWRARLARPQTGARAAQSGQGEASAPSDVGAGAVTPDSSPLPSGPARFESIGALRLFLRTVLFGLPPGRMERREVTDAALPDRPLPASVAKRRLLEVVRELAVEDAAFAELVLPVLEAFSHSQARGEWHGCVAALARIQRAHPDLHVALPG